MTLKVDLSMESKMYGFPLENDWFHVSFRLDRVVVNVLPIPGAGKLAVPIGGPTAHKTCTHCCLCFRNCSQTETTKEH